MPGSSVPIYRQIVDQVGLAILRGDLSPGDPLPSVRAVAERLVVNPNTVARAYADLVREGHALTQPGKGLTVAPRRQMLSEEERRRRLNLALDEFVREIVFLDFGRDEILGCLSEKLVETVGREER
ncbi:MAG: GntR family transcriptional regulator, partial [Armatimonadota bacterium]|nr:GntR family transcriptional regulator [Armatimonadota bacterium]